MDEKVIDWKGAASPSLTAQSGRFVALEPFEASRHAAPLFEATKGEENAALWTYLPFPAPPSAELFGAALSQKQGDDAHHWRTYYLSSAEAADAVGMASYMRMRPMHGSVEVGAILLSAKLQRTRAASEAMFLMARHVFDDLGYRRYEWKCDNANLASRRAANRFGFTFEGVFRNDMVVKGRSRDTAWYSITDVEWPALRGAFERWLDPANFDEKGRQITSLAAMRRS